MSASTQLLKAHALLRRVFGTTAARLAVFTAVALVAKWPLLATAATLTDFRDAEYNLLFEQAARIAVKDFHQAPLWNPYYCGGLPALATPSARFVSPTFLLTLLFGAMRADPLVALVMTVIGLEGAFRYARARGASSLGAAAAAPIYALSGVFASAPALGWTNFFGFELVPWVAYGMRRALGGSVRGAVVAAVAMAWVVGHGGTYATPLAVLLCATEAIERVLARRARGLGPMIGMGALTAVLALGLAAVRLWPIAELLASSPRVLGGAPGNSPGTIASSLLGDGPTSLARGAFLVGALAVPVALAGVLTARPRRGLTLLVGAGLWLWLAAGYSAAVPLFSGLRTVPPFTMLRYPERFLVLFALTFATLAALGVSRLEALARKRPRLAFGWTVAVGLLVADASLLVSNDQAQAAGSSRLPPPVEEARDFKQARGNRWLAAHYAPMGRGSLSCFDDYQVPESPLLRGDLAKEEYVRDPADGDVERRSWSPNRIDLHVALRRPATVYVNQNWHPGWRASAGEVKAEQGLLAIDLPAGEHDVALRFLPRSGVGGALTSLAALVAAVVLWARAGRKDTLEGSRAWTASAMLVVLPLAVGGATRALVPEPPMAPPALLTPAGEAIVVDAPGEDTSPLGTTLEEGITLEAAKLQVSTTTPEERTVSLELDWRLAARAPKGTGVFVHIKPSKGDTVNIDHALVSGVLPLEDAPVGRTLRDVSIPVALPKTTEPLTWKVYAGLWMARRGGERVRVVSKGEATIDEDRVLVGTFETP